MAPESDSRLRSYYHFKGPPDFPKFQSAFDLIIALSSTEPGELLEVASRVCARETAVHAEYRQLFSPMISVSEFEEKTGALAEAMEAACKNHPGKTFRLVMSLPRNPVTGPVLFESVRKLKRAGKNIVGIDFCAQEEGYPPSLLSDLLSAIKSAEERYSILYHVGESFRDKSVESAVRWVVEAALAGAHRLGHAAALGMDPEVFRGSTREELASERLDQIDFEIKNYDSIREFILARPAPGSAAAMVPNKDQLSQEARDIRSSGKKVVSVFYSPERTEFLRAFQDWAMSQVAATGAVVECCPASNQAIIGITRNHPLLRFLKSNVRCVIGADDPGIFDTDLEREFETVRKWGVSESEIAQLKKNSLEFTSEKLTSVD